MLKDEKFKIFQSKFVESVDDEEAEFGYRLIDEENTPQEIIDEFYEVKKLVLDFP